MRPLVCSRVLYSWVLARVFSLSSSMQDSIHSAMQDAGCAKVQYKMPSLSEVLALFVRHGSHGWSKFVGSPLNETVAHAAASSVCGIGCPQTVAVVGWCVALTLPVHGSGCQLRFWHCPAGLERRQVCTARVDGQPGRLTDAGNTQCTQP